MSYFFTVSWTESIVLALRTVVFGQKSILLEEELGQDSVVVSILRLLINTHWFDPCACALPLTAVFPWVAYQLRYAMSQLVCALLIRRGGHFRIRQVQDISFQSSPGFIYKSGWFEISEIKCISRICFTACLMFISTSWWVEESDFKFWLSANCNFSAKCILSTEVLELYQPELIETEFRGQTVTFIILYFDTRFFGG